LSDDLCILTFYLSATVQSKSMLFWLLLILVRALVSLEKEERKVKNKNRRKMRQEIQWEKRWYPRT
jgi:hypothetical protein